METEAASARWAGTWQRAWPAGDVAAIEPLYAPHASYRSSALAEPEPGGVAAYLARQFAAEQDVRGRFGSRRSQGCRGVVGQLGGGRSAVTLDGVTVLRFEVDGRVVDHVDYWLSTRGRREPYPGWAS